MVPFDKTWSNANVKSTLQVKRKFAPRLQNLADSSNAQHSKNITRDKGNFLQYGIKKKSVPLAKQLLAKAKVDTRIRKQRLAKKDCEQIRSRFGRVVKCKKLDYDDVTSPKFWNKRLEQTEQRHLKPKSLKRPLDDQEFPPSKALRSAEVKLEKMEFPVDQTVYVNNPGRFIVSCKLHSTSTLVCSCD